MKLKILSLFLVLNVSRCFAVKIVMLPDFAVSHYLVMAKLADELKARGHQVTILLGNDTTFAIGKPYVKTFELTDKFKTELLTQYRNLISSVDNKSFLGQLSKLFYTQQMYCNLCLSSGEAMEELRAADLLIGEPKYLCASLAADMLSIPNVVVNMGPIVTPTLRVFGISSNPAYVPQFMSELPGKMTFLDRMKNFGWYLANVFIVEGYIYPLYREIKERHNITPNKSVRESLATADLILLQRDFIMDHVQPLQPNVQVVGNFLTSPAQPLPSELEEFMQRSGDEGVILVSFGSLISGSFTDDVINVMKEAFSLVPQNVLWKLEPSLIEGVLPPNIKTLSWLPQNDILGHEKTKLFVTHAGGNGLAEAGYHGVPVICSPVFSDQHDNARYVQDGGWGETLSMTTTTAEQLVRLLNKVIHEKKYRKRMSHVSKIMKARPRSPVKEAADLVEYVHAIGNLDYLRARNTDLAFYQLYMVDVLLVFGITVCVVLGIFVKLVRVVLGGLTKKVKTS